MLPLYAEIPRDSFEQACTAHSGLLFDKFPDAWNPDENYQPKKSKADKSKTKDDDPKKEFLRSVIKKYDENSSLLSLYLESALKNQRALAAELQCQSLENFESLIVSTDWRFVSGLGSAHPYETGFIWHRTLSVPYLPGSSVKGLMRAYATYWCDQSQQQEYARLFGTEGTKTEPATAGTLIVFDALPTKPPSLEIDILNPHYSKYYQDPATPPADYLSPIPVFFLTVAPGQDFEFFLASRAGESNQALQDLETGLKLMRKALEILGAGGKTAVGYGAFKESKAELQNREVQKLKLEQAKQNEAANAELDTLVITKGYTGLAEEIYRHSQRENWASGSNTDKFYQAAFEFLPKMAQEADAQGKQNAIKLMSEIVQNKFPGIMQEPDKTKKKGTPVYKDNARKIAKELLRLKM